MECMKDPIESDDCRAPRNAYYTCKHSQLNMRTRIRGVRVYWQKYRMEYSTPINFDVEENIAKNIKCTRTLCSYNRYIYMIVISIIVNFSYNSIPKNPWIKRHTSVSRILYRYFCLCTLIYASFDYVLLKSHLHYIIPPAWFILAITLCSFSRPSFTFLTDIIVDRYSLLRDDLIDVIYNRINAFKNDFSTHTYLPLPIDHEGYRSFAAMAPACQM